MPAEVRISRKEHILQSLARMLESSPGERITTAALAREVGVSEAALYRHFPSKARMFEGLIAFIEETLFTRITRILEDEPSAARRCEKILTLVLTFAEKNPGMTRLLTGDALQGETERLRVRISQLFDRLEAQIRENLKCAVSPTVMANLLMASTEGRLMQFVRSEFKKQPTEHWDDQWALLSREMLVTFA